MSQAMGSGERDAEERTRGGERDAEALTEGGEDCPGGGEIFPIRRGLAERFGGWDKWAFRPIGCLECGHAAVWGSSGIAREVVWHSFCL